MAGSAQVPLKVVAGEWARIGVTGFGGPPAHVALLRRLCVERRGWLPAQEFEDGFAAASLLPGPASTQLAIFCGWRVAGITGAIVGGACFIVPGLILIIALAALFLAAQVPAWIAGAAAGAGAAVPAVAVAAAAGLMPASWQRAGPALAGRVRWCGYLAAAAAAAVLAGPFVVLVLAGCGLIEVGCRSRWRDGEVAGLLPALMSLAVRRAPVLAAGLAPLAWVAFKVGALSYGGGFVIIPLMQHDAVHTYHWMSASQFLTAVALGQVTPGPVVLTVAAVGFAAAGVGGALLAALIAFTPSFAFVLLAGPRFDRIRASPVAQAFLTGAGPAAIGAIAGAAVTLGLYLRHPWQAGVLAAALCWLVPLRRGVVTAMAGAALIGVIVALAAGAAAVR